MKHFHVALALAAVGLSASAQTLQGIQLEPAQAKVGDEVTLTARFDVSSGQNCNVRIEYGDGAQQNVAVNQDKDATMVFKHRYDKPGSYTISVRPVTKMPVLKCLGAEQKASVAVAAAAAPAGMKRMGVPTGARPQCPPGWSLDAKSVVKKSGAFTCRAKAGTATPEGKLACPGALGYFENAKRGQLGCRE